MKKLCPLCSSTLLRHLHQHKVGWFCTSCRQEMPNLNVNFRNTIYENFLQTKNYQDKQKIPDTEYTIMSHSSIKSQAEEEILAKIPN